MEQLEAEQEEIFGQYDGIEDESAGESLTPVGSETQSESGAYTGSKEKSVNFQVGDAEDHEHDSDAKHSRDAFKSISASFAGSMFEATTASLGHADIEEEPPSPRTLREAIERAKNSTYYKDITESHHHTTMLDSIEPSHSVGLVTLMHRPEGKVIEQCTSLFGWGGVSSV
eukprot:TRINITY_DN11437_c0_g1_i2.p1 TRINITY_DN11437_c0_g1~~TRINITY_DN11437_c0_g1_i2.p1  ORF type:complete len:171 (+),score=24.99 TRINITY_DN11437_c0_g1_i2:295-807(+)